jgi:hypothetical protein
MVICHLRVGIVKVKNRPLVVKISVRKVFSAFEFNGKLPWPTGRNKPDHPRYKQRFRITNCNNKMEANGSTLVLLPSLLTGRAMAQAVSWRHVAAEARFRALVSPYWIFSGHGGTGTDFSPSSSVFACQYHSTVVLHTHVSHNTATGVRSSETSSHPIDMNKMTSVRLLA